MTCRCLGPDHDPWCAPRPTPDNLDLDRVNAAIASTGAEPVSERRLAQLTVIDVDREGRSKVPGPDA